MEIEANTLSKDQLLIRKRQLEGEVETLRIRLHACEHEISFVNGAISVIGQMEAITPPTNGMTENKDG